LDRVWHGHMAVMRGVEDGFSIARAAKGGSLTVSDDRGRMLAETRSDSAPFATLGAMVPAVHDNSLSPAGGLVRVGHTGDSPLHTRAAADVVCSTPRVLVRVAHFVVGRGFGRIPLITNRQSLHLAILPSVGSTA
jgi:hypothetical protein